MELVSIIVPVYNVEKYLRECVDSLLQQTYKNLDIILVDDGSKDQSGAICDEYAEKDKRIKVIHKDNAGLGYARNSGLEIATGSYVTFIDSDDIADTNLVELLMQGIQKCSADTCIGGFKRISEDGKPVFKEQYDEVVYVGRDVYDSLFARMLGSAPDKHDAMRMSVWNVMYSTEIIRKHNLRFPSEREFISEDIIWDSDYYKYAKCVKVIPSTAYSYRITPGSLTQKFMPERFEMVCRLYNELNRRIENNLDMKNRLQRQFFVNLRVCIRQEKKSISKKSGRENKDRIKLILNSDTVKRIIIEYPIKRTQLKPHIFILLIKYKLVNIITVANDWNLI